MRRLLGIVALLILSTGLTACSQGTEDGERSTGKSGTLHRATTNAREDETTSPDATQWNYVALGDSLAAGVGARQGYVERYARYLRDDTGARVKLINLGVSGQTSSQLLRALEHNPSVRNRLRDAEVVTYNIGINDLGLARGSYDAGTCGGSQGERCLRAAVKEFEANWDKITIEIQNLRSPDETIIRTAGLGYTPRAGKSFEPYLKRANRHIVASAARSNIPYAEVSLGNEGLSPDGLHPDDSGYEAIADRLRGLEYEPLSSR